MIDIRDCELAEAGTRAVLRPVAADWSATSPATRRLELAAGEAWSSRCRGIGELPIGSALITDAGALPAEFVIHVAIRSREEAVSETSVRLALTNGLRRAREWAVLELALPLIGTGPGNLEPEAACEAMDGALADFEGLAGSRLVVCSRDRFELAAARRWWGGPRPE